ncbi:MAG: flagellum-specific peptidoglycan hydrolase FlgJ [Polaribacter sp.]|jgi:flagellum-specific peptidoglycan hydrolase FlgJ
MQSTLTTTKMGTYVRTHWFKMIMIGMVVFIFLRKDFSFSINLNDPSKTEQESAPLKEEVRQQKTSKKESPITVNHEIAKASGTSLFDMLSSVSLGGTTTKKEKKELAVVSESTREAYIGRFAKVAINERKKFGIPASIILANGLLHSSGGTRDMVLAGNNHFGLPCTTNWRGESATYNDACYRHYENAWTSFRDHSLYLTTGSTKNLVRLGSTDYKAWATAMEKVSIFEIDDLANKLIEIIEGYNLDKLDKK